MRYRNDLAGPPMDSVSASAATHTQSALIRFGIRLQQRRADQNADSCERCKSKGSFVVNPDRCHWDNEDCQEEHSHEEDSRDIQS